MAFLPCFPVKGTVRMFADFLFTALFHGLIWPEKEVMLRKTKTDFSNGSTSGSICICCVSKS